jgi:hypothetical protein
MPNAWGGTDPTEVVDPADYELGCEYVATVDITITHVRVWAGASEVAVTGRKGRIWSVAGAQLGIATLADDLPTGWSSYALDTPVERLAGQHFVVSYSTGGNYGALVNGLDVAVDSGDGAVTAVAFSSGAHGNGSFHGTPGTFPDNASSNHAFFGADATYSLGIGGNTAPRITQATVTATGAVATATIVAEDDETLVGAVYRYDWGDGSPVTSSSSATAQHTYSASGEYAVLMSVTDADGLADFAAAAVRVDVPSAELQALNAEAIIQAVVSHALASGRFERVNGHEPKNAPGAGGVTAAVWIESIGPARANSGLQITTALLVLNVRLYASMLTEPQDAIDPRIVAAVDALMTAYSGDFTLGGLVRSVDLLGLAGTPMGARAGYLNQDNKLYRVMTITLPVLKNDVWEQVQ